MRFFNNPAEGLEVYSGDDMGWDSTIEYAGEDSESQLYSDFYTLYDACESATYCYIYIDVDGNSDYHTTESINNSNIRASGGYIQLDFTGDNSINDVINIDPEDGFRVYDGNGQSLFGKVRIKFTYE